MNQLFKNLFITGLKANQVSNIHTSSAVLAWSKSDAPKSFVRHNNVVYPPQSPDEEPRPARFSCGPGPEIFKPVGTFMPKQEFVCHQKVNIKYSPEKLWYIASFVRGMTVDEAVKQLSFVHKKGAIYVKQAILEAQELAVKQHNVEFKSNLWVAESFSGKGMVIKGIRRHARGRMGEVRYQYSHYFVRLEEGKPPADYYKRNPQTPQQQLENWLEQMRKRKIVNSY